MKVVLFCGGMGLRMRDASHSLPKPMIPLGGKPLLWHIIRYYAHFGHREFILCLGHGGDIIRNYLTDYEKCLELYYRLPVEPTPHLDDDLDWRDVDLRFVDTGLNSTIGERLKALQPHLAGEEMFLANYGDCITDAPLPDIIDSLQDGSALASFLSVRPHFTFHLVRHAPDGAVEAIVGADNCGMWGNGGYFALRPEVLDLIRPGEELVVEAFHRLIARRQLRSVRHTGFWRGVDTFKDLQQLDADLRRGKAPWQVWKAKPRRAAAGSVAGGAAVTGLAASA